MNLSSEKRSTSKQVLLCFLTNFTNLAPSMSLGYSAVALPALTDPSAPFRLTASEASWFASAAALGTPFGCLLAGPVSDSFGRKAGMFAVNVMCFLGWMAIFLASKSEQGQLPLLLAARAFTGFSTGLSSVPTIVYMAEVSVPKLRGFLCTCTAVFYSLGILLIYILGYIFSKNWEIIALITSLLPLIACFLLVFFVPESPLWLFRQGRIQQARKSFRYLYNTTNASLEAVEEEIQSLQQSSQINNSTSPKKASLLQASCLKPLILIAIFFVFQQFSGTFVILFYAINIIRDAGIEVDAYLTVILIGLVRTVAAVILSCLCRVCGIRLLGLCSGIGMSVSMILLGGYSFMVHNGMVPADLAENVYVNFIPIFLILFYILASTVGFLPLPFAMNAECFPGDIRGTASGITCGIGYSFNFVVVKLYPVMVDCLGSSGVFWFYGGMCVVGTIFIAVFVPETKGKSLDDIQKLFETKPGERFSLFVRFKSNEVLRNSINK